MKTMIESFGNYYLDSYFTMYHYKNKIFWMFVSVFALSTIFAFDGTLDYAEAATVGAHVTKINTDFNDMGEASVAFEVCSGNNHIMHPQIIVSSDKESKTITMNRDLEPDTCHGGVTILMVNDLSSIAAFLETETGDIAVDDIARHLESGKMAFSWNVK